MIVFTDKSTTSMFFWIGANEPIKAPKMNLDSTIAQ